MKSFLLLAVCTFNAVLCYDCNFPPELWCSSKEIAAKCQVENQCVFSAWKDVQTATPVNFTLYYESLCPGCREFIKDQLFTVWNELKSIINVELVPYGNAEEHMDQSTHRWVFQCQHGIEECKGNLIETCAVNLLKTPESYFPFIHCIEVSQDFPEKSAPECARQHHIHYEPIMNCSKSAMGNQLEHEMAVKTDKLSPPHQYVPWVTLNGVHTEDIQRKAQTNLLELICDTYQGPKPKECTQLEILSRCPRN